MIVIQLPSVKRIKTERPEKCNYCQGQILQRYGEVRKPVEYTRIRNVQVYRYRCASCGQTFRHYLVEEMIAMLREKIHRALTEEECQQYFHCSCTIE